MKNVKVISSPNKECKQIKLIALKCDNVFQGKSYKLKKIAGKEPVICLNQQRSADKWHFYCVILNFLEKSIKFAHYKNK